MLSDAIGLSFCNVPVAEGSRVSVMSIGRENFGIYGDTELSRGCILDRGHGKPEIGINFNIHCFRYLCFDIVNKVGYKDTTICLNGRKKVFLQRRKTTKMRQEHTISSGRETMSKCGILSVCFDPFSSKSGPKTVLINNYEQGCSIDFPCCPFTGKEKDEETGYGYFGARYMDHELMTGWLSVDPMLEMSPNMSPYHYCHWNPVKLVDPDGNIPILIPLIIGAIEIGTAIYDAVDAGKTLLDEDATSAAKWAAVGCLALDIALPGGGYGVAYKMTSKTVFKIAGKECRNASEFYKITKKLPVGERLRTYREMADVVAEKENWVFDKVLSKKNGGRRIYTDKSSGIHYSLDTEKGHFEVLDRKGKHQGSIDFDGNAVDKRDKSGRHDIQI